MKNRT